MSKKKKGYKVGYGKPPKHTQFGAENGNKRNNKGRPPGRNILEFDRLSEEALWYCFHESAQQPVPIVDGDQETVIPLIMVIAKRMAKDAARGDPHARRDYLKYLEKAVKGKDKLVVEAQSILAEFQERKLMALEKPGSLQCFDEFYSWFLSKKHFRAMDGEERWLYEDEEPVTDADWALFMKQYKYLKDNPKESLAWPPHYPSRELEEE